MQPACHKSSGKTGKQTLKDFIGSEFITKWFFRPEEEGGDYYQVLEDVPIGATEMPIRLYNHTGFVVEKRRIVPVENYRDDALFHPPTDQNPRPDKKVDWKEEVRRLYDKRVERI